MFDIGWPELLLIGIVTLIVVGPKELPRVLRTVMLWVRKARKLAREFQSGIDEMVREADLQDLKRDIERTATADLDKDLENTIDPTGAVAGFFDDDPQALVDGAAADAKEAGPAASQAADPEAAGETAPAADTDATPPRQIEEAKA